MYNNQSIIKSANLNQDFIINIFINFFLLFSEVVLSITILIFSSYILLKLQDFFKFQKSYRVKFNYLLTNSVKRE